MAAIVIGARGSAEEPLLAPQLLFQPLDLLAHRLADRLDARLDRFGDSARPVLSSLLRVAEPFLAFVHALAGLLAPLAALFLQSLARLLARLRGKEQGQSRAEQEPKCECGRHVDCAGIPISHRLPPRLRMFVARIRTS